MCRIGISMFAAVTGSAAFAQGPEDLLEVQVAGAFGEGFDSFVVWLEEVGGDERIALPATPMEATPISVYTQGPEIPRPMSHRLLCNIIEAVDATLVGAVIGPETELGICQAALWVETPQGELTPSTRPSDAVAVALCAECPIFVVDEPLAETGPLPEPMVEYSFAGLEQRDTETDPTTVRTMAILQDINEERRFLIWLAAIEADAIWLAMPEPKPKRLRIHDTLVAILQAVDVRVTRLVIGDLVGETVIGTLYLAIGNEEAAVDCRPSDGMAIALRAEAPIYMAQTVAEQLALGAEE